VKDLRIFQLISFLWEKRLIKILEDIGKILKDITFKVKVLLVPIYNGFRFFPQLILVSNRPKVPNILYLMRHRPV
jgi:hypothetical protein